MSHTDEQCVRSCLDGNPGAYRHLIEWYELPLRRYLRARLGNAEAAIEAAQETFVRAYLGLGELRKPGAFFTWLLGIADLVAKETHRAAQQRRTVKWPQIELADRSYTRDAGSEGTVTEAVARLPDVYRQVVLLRFYGGYTCAEISRDLNVPLGTVTKRLSRAYDLLREHLNVKAPNRQSEARR